MKRSRNILRQWALTAVYLSGLLSLAIAFSGCGKKSGTAKGPVVAEVGGRPIELREITDPIIAAHVDYSTAEDELKARRKELDRLIEEKFLVIGAYARSLDADIGIIELVDKEKDKFLLDELFRHEVIDKAQVAEDEVRQWYEHWFDRVRPKHILVKTKAKADSIVTDLKAGGDFGDLAEKYSADPATARRGGDFGREFYWGELIAPIQSVVFDLKQGEIGGPVESQFGWHVLEIVSRSELTKLPLDSVRVGIENRLRQKLQDKRRTAQLQELRSKANIQVRADVAGQVRQQFQEVVDSSQLPVGYFPEIPVSKVPDQLKKQVLATYGRQGELTVDKLIQAYNAAPTDGRPDLRLDDQIQETVFQLGLYDLLRDEALRLQLDQSPVYKERLREFQEQLMADKMRNEVVQGKLHVEETDVRQFYDAHADSFVEPVSYHVREVMVNDEPSAVRVLREAQAGTPMADLAKRYTMRAGFRNNGGDLGLVSPDRYPDLYTTAATLKPGEIGGPVPGIDQFSVIQVLDVKPAGQKPYDDVRGKIYEKLQSWRTDSIMGVYADSMRVLYPVEIHDQILAAGIHVSQ